MNIFSQLFQSAIAYHQVHRLTGINYWRHLVFTGVFGIGLWVIFPAYLAGEIIAVQVGRWDVFIINTFLYGIAIFLFVHKNLPYQVRFAIGVHLCFILGCILCVIRGPLSVGPIWLFAFPVMGGILLGRRFATYALSLNALVLGFIFLGIHSGSLGSWVSASINRQFWLMYSLNHLCISTVVTVSLVILMEGLEKNIDRVQSMMRLRERRNQQLKERIDAYLEANAERIIMTNALDKSPIATLIFREDGTMRYANVSALTLLNITDKMYARLLRELEISSDETLQAALQIAQAQGQAKCEVQLQNADQQPIDLEMHLHHFQHDEEQLLCAFALDISHRKDAEDQLRYLAYHDYLTGLPNRAMYLRELGNTLQQAQRDRDFKFALLFVDLDHFKMVNDSLGHLAGDAFLKQIGERFVQSIGQYGLVSRLGGDEFAFLIQNYEQEQEIWVIIEQIFHSLQVPLSYEHHQVQFTASIGVVLDVDVDTTPEFLLRDADIAMYEAKFSGGNQAIVLEQTMRQKFMQRFELKNDLERAIAAEEFVLHYQPIVCAHNSKLVGFEALVRWQHPEQGLLFPDQFIPLAESSRLIIPLGQQILTQACQQLSIWRDRAIAFQDLTIHINLSALQFDHPELIATIQELLLAYQLPPCAIKLEITESIMMADVEAAIATLKNIKEYGVQIAMDDFGTGYSSLACLQDFPIDTLKIDKSFILPLLENPQKVAMVQVILSLAQALAFEVVAEGVETADHAQILQELGCPMMQGWFYGRPMDRDRVEREMLQPLLKHMTTPHTWQPTNTGVYFQAV